MNSLFFFKSKFEGAILLPKLSLILLFITLQIQTTKASHLTGATIAYTPIAPNQYQVTLSIYQECSELDAPSFQEITIESPTCTSYTATLDFIHQSVFFDNNNIHGPCLATGVCGLEAYIYQDTITFPHNCTEWTMSWTECCYNGLITNLAYPNYEKVHVRTSLNTSLTPPNSSVFFLNYPFYTALVGEFNSVYPNGIDLDGDGLVYSLVDCYDSPQSNVFYNDGFSGEEPFHSINGVDVDPATGNMHFTPTTRGVSAVCLLIEEFRNGQKIAETIQSMQFVLCGDDLVSNSIQANLEETSILELIPNPAQNQVNIQYNIPFKETTSLEIFNLQGQLIHTQMQLAPNGKVSINVQDWAPTVYLVALKNPNGEVLLTERLIIE